MRTTTGLALALTLAACGGNNGSGTGAGTISVAPTPAPTPSPSPTPTPAPTPTPTPTPTSSGVLLGGFAAAPARLPTTGATLRLGKCINLSNMLEAPNEGDWGRAFRDSDIANMKAQGFTGLRLPVRFSNHAGTTAPYTIDPVFMARVKHIVDLAVAAGMSVIIDLHHYDAMLDDPAGNTARFTAMWRQIGVTFRDQPLTVYFELFNEPRNKLDASNLASIIDPALAAVRESNPTRLVVIDGPNWASLSQMATTPMPADRYVVPTFHYYSPDNFGLASANYMNPPVRETWGTAADIAELEANLVKLRTYMNATGRVPFAGEYGATIFRADPERAKYYATVSNAFASVGVQSCAWGYNNTYHLYTDAAGWKADVVGSIGTTTTLP